MSISTTIKYQFSPIILVMMMCRYSSQLHSIPSFLNNPQSFDLYYTNQYNSLFHLLIVIYRKPVTPFNSLKFYLLAHHLPLICHHSWCLTNHLFNTLDSPFIEIFHLKDLTLHSPQPHFPRLMPHAVISLGTVPHQKSCHTFHCH